MHTLQESLKLGWVVILALAVLTAIEFVVAIATKDELLFVLLLVVALVKAWLIIQYFMHFGQLWQHVSNAWDGMLYDSDEEDED
jgi:heme/copper-type cytochrome/quinol oxidase subunit 4